MIGLSNYNYHRVYYLWCGRLPWNVWVDVKWSLRRNLYSYPVPFFFSFWYYDIDLDFCGSHTPCQHDAICINIRPNEYACRCTDGFEGQDCELGKNMEWQILWYFFYQLSIPRVTQKCHLAVRSFPSEFCLRL